MKKNQVLAYVIVMILPTLLAGLSAYSQAVKGRVVGLEKGSGKTTVLPFANLQWLGTSQGGSTNEAGEFNLTQPQGHSGKLVVSYVGYVNDTLKVSSARFMEIRLNSREMDEIQVRERKPGEVISKLKTIQTQTITSTGLRKMACCNLSESFQNSVTVDVGYTDAVSGAKQIKMLGLAGIYSQMMVEKRPSFSGLSAPFGLMYIPGTWMESIQVSKGTSSVADGFESITGQINVEFKKPETEGPLFINLFLNNEQKAELNLHMARKVSENWSTMLLGHTSVLKNKIDMNHDHFLDIPTSKQINLTNRWRFDNHTNREGIFGIHFIHEDRTGGQEGFNDHESHFDQDSVYGIGITNRKLELFGKHGIMLNPALEQSLGMILNLTHHEQDAFFGHRVWEARQNSLFFNAIFSTHFRNEEAVQVAEPDGHSAHQESHGETLSENKLTAGFSFKADEFVQMLDTLPFDRKEMIPGIYSEITWSPAPKWVVLGGIRGDYSSYSGFFVTPRVHVKYAPFEHTVVRFSAGKGYRSPMVLSENLSLLASSRQLVFEGEPKREEAFNVGINLVQTIPLDKKRKMTASVDFYRTEFIHQTVINLDRASNQLVFSSLDGKSYSNSFQTEVVAEPIRNLEMTLAFRWNDVKTDLDGTLMEKPFVNDYKGLLALSWASKFEKWKIDFSTQYNGRSRMPDLSGNPDAGMHFSDHSPAYFIHNMQITRKFKDFDLYAGVENLGDYYQEHSIISHSNPFGSNFDASMVWGPLSGRMIFAGFRFML